MVQIKLMLFKAALVNATATCAAQPEYIDPTVTAHMQQMSTRSDSQCPIDLIAISAICDLSSEEDCLVLPPKPQ
jgi:hypothetical protein